MMQERVRMRMRIVNGEMQDGESSVGRDESQVVVVRYAGPGRRRGSSVRSEIRTRLCGGLGLDP
jgi:hypothetical protein